MLQATELRKGHIIKHKGELWRVLETMHMTPGNLRGFVRAKLRNLKSGGSIEERFQSTDKFEQAIVETKEVEYSYVDGGNLVFLDPTTYEQIYVPKGLVDAEDLPWLQENMGVTLTVCEGEPTGIELPPAVEATVVETEPFLRGATVSNVFKPAKLDNGVSIQVPPFIERGERIVVNPREKKYVERASEKK